MADPFLQACLSYKKFYFLLGVDIWINNPVSYLERSDALEMVDLSPFCTAEK